MAGQPREIEHKYLIRMPAEEMLMQKEGCVRIEITQDYLVKEAGKGSCRVRRAETPDGVRYFFTQKEHISAIERIEREREITFSEYEEYQKMRDPELIQIKKTRYRYPENGHVYEVDIFPFWKKQAFLEIEVPAVDTKIRLPEDLQLLREVTEDRRYTNRALAREIPQEEA